MTTIHLDLLAAVTGGNGTNNSFDAQTAFNALSSAYATGNNQNIMGGYNDTGSPELRMRADNGSGIACTRSSGANPTYACRTFTGE